MKVGYATMLDCVGRTGLALVKSSATEKKTKEDRTWVNYWDKEQERWSASRDRLLLFRFVLRSSSVQDFEEIRSLCSHSRMNVRLQKQTTNHLTLHDVLPVDRREVW